MKNVTGNGRKIIKNLTIVSGAILMTLAVFAVLPLLQYRMSLYGNIKVDNSKGTFLLVRKEPEKKTNYDRSRNMERETAKELPRSETQKNRTKEPPRLSIEPVRIANLSSTLEIDPSVLNIEGPGIEDINDLLHISVRGTGKWNGGQFEMDEVDQMPETISAVKPNYPYRARRMSIEGYVTVRFLVDCSGAVSELTILKAEPEGIFEESVKKTLAKWCFRPGQKDGRRVNTWVKTTIEFALDDTALKKIEFSTRGL